MSARAAQQTLLACVISARQVILLDVEHGKPLLTAAGNAVPAWGVCKKLMNGVLSQSLRNRRRSRKKKRRGRRFVDK